MNNPNMIRTMRCPCGEICYAEECNYTQTCMHMDESPNREITEEDCYLAPEDKQFPQER